MKYLLLFVALILLVNCSDERVADKNKKVEINTADSANNVVVKTNERNPYITIDSSSFSENEKVEFEFKRIDIDTVVIILTVHKGEKHYQLVDTTSDFNWAGFIHVKNEPSLGRGYLVSFYSVFLGFDCYDYFEIKNEALVCTFYSEIVDVHEGREFSASGKDGLRYAGFLGAYNSVDSDLFIDLNKNIPHQFRKFKGKKWCDMIALWKKISSVRDVVDDHIDDSWRAKEDTMQCL